MLRYKVASPAQKVRVLTGHQPQSHLFSCDIIYMNMSKNCKREMTVMLC